MSGLVQMCQVAHRHSREPGGLPIIGDLFVSRQGEGVFATTYSARGSLYKLRIGANPLRRSFPFCREREALEARLQSVDEGLRRTAGDAEDGSVTVFFFGATQGGNVQANIDRWLGQMAQPDGRASKDVATSTRSTTTSGLPLTVVDVPGTYVAEVAPGSSEKFNKPGFRQIAVYIDTPGGPYFVKALGPAKTIAKWSASVEAFLKSVSYK